MSTPKALNSVAQGKLHEFRECGATLGYESNESSVEPKSFQLRGTSPRPKQAADGFRPRRRAASEDTVRLGRSCHFFRYPGWRSIRYRESRLPWATVFNAFGVLIDATFASFYRDLCITMRAEPGNKQSVAISVGICRSYDQGLYAVFPNYRKQTILVRKDDVKQGGFHACLVVGPGPETLTEPTPSSGIFPILRF